MGQEDNHQINDIISGDFQWEKKNLIISYLTYYLLFNLYAEYIIQDAGLNEAQAEIKIVRRNINNLRYTGDTTLMAESEEELKSLRMKMKEDTEKAGLKVDIQKT